MRINGVEIPDQYAGYLPRALREPKSGDAAIAIIQYLDDWSYNIVLVPLWNGNLTQHKDRACKTLLGFQDFRNMNGLHQPPGLWTTFLVKGHD